MVHLLALLGVLAISFSAILVRLAGVAPPTSAFFRCAYALPVLALVWICFHRRRDRRTASTRWLAFAAGLLLGLDLNVWHRAIELIGAGLSTVLGNTQVVFVGAAAWLLHGERPSRIAIFAVPVVFTGVVLISGLGRSDAYGSNPVLGAVFGLLTALAYTAFLLIYRYANRQKVPPAGPMLDATAGAVLATLVLGLFEESFELDPVWPAHAWLILLALGSQVIGWLLISYVLPRLPALQTSVILLMQPALTVVWALLLLGELLSPLQWSGVTLVLGGVGALSVLGSMERATPDQCNPDH
jgi:drug/metabolite transporter (DMT)-like permease